MPQPFKYLTPADVEKIDRITETYRGYRLDDTVGFIESARLLLDADYVMWCVGQRNKATCKSAILEFYHSCAATNDPAVLEQQRDWLRIGSEMNIDRFSGDILAELTEKCDHLTVRQADIERPSVRQVFKNLMAAIRLARLYILKDRAGLGDFMFTLYRNPHNAHSDEGFGYGSGIGYHRVKSKPPFSERDREAAHELSLRNPWIHSVGVNTEFDATRLEPDLRILLPFLLRAFPVTEIGAILARCSKTISNAHIPKIARAMGLKVHNRDAIREFYRPRISHGATQPSAAEAVDIGLRSLE